MSPAFFSEGCADALLRSHVAIDVEGTLLASINSVWTYGPSASPCGRACTPNVKGDADESLMTSSRLRPRSLAPRAGRGPIHGHYC